MGRRKAIRYVDVYTDGSYSQEKGVHYCGYGVWFGENHCDNYQGVRRAKYSLTSELLAIEKALEIIYRRRDSLNYQIITDCTEAYNMIVSRTCYCRSPKTVNLVSNIVGTMHSISGKVVMLLIYGHSGIRGNDEAHWLANKGRKSAIEDSYL